MRHRAILVATMILAHAARSRAKPRGQVAWSKDNTRVLAPLLALHSAPTSRLRELSR
jgi:hypothetical protein